MTILDCPSCNKHTLKEVFLGDIENWAEAATAIINPFIAIPTALRVLKHSPYVRVFRDPEDVLRRKECSGKRFVCTYCHEKYVLCGHCEQLYVVAKHPGLNETVKCPNCFWTIIMDLT